MTMVKLLNLEKIEVLRLVEALEHHYAQLRAAHCEDAFRYAELAEMLKRMAKLDSSPMNGTASAI
jgi:hypothetical protein